MTEQEHLTSQPSEDADYESPFLGPVGVTDLIERSDADPNDLIRDEDRSQPLKILTRKLPLMLDVSIFVM